MLDDIDLLPSLDPALHPWKVCDVDSLLLAARHAELDATLDAALAASLTDGDAEARYHAAWPSDLQGCIAAGAQGLARLKAWQRACPDSAHAQLAEAVYWRQWSCDVLCSERAGGLFREGHAFAAACTVRAAVCALRSMTLAPSGWYAAALMLQIVAGGQPPVWLAELAEQGARAPQAWRGEVDGHEIEPLLTPRVQPGAGAAMKRLLLECGLRDEPVDLPTRLPCRRAPLGAHRQSDSAARHWLQVIVDAHPRAFAPLASAVDSVGARRDGSFNKVPAFLALPACAHLSEVERDRLMHMHWRHRERLMLWQAEPDELRDAMGKARRRAGQALWPPHRWEVLDWLARAHLERDEGAQALACLKDGDRSGPVPCNETLALAVTLALRHDPDGRWLSEAVARSADARACQAALVLRGHGLFTGTLGEPLDPAAADVWWAEARRHPAGPKVWGDLGFAFWEAGRHQDAFALFMRGVDEGCTAYLTSIGTFFEEGLHGEVDLDRAIDFYQRAVDLGGSAPAYRLARLYSDQSAAAADGAAQGALQLKAVQTMLLAHELGDPDALEEALMFIGDLHPPHLTDRHVRFLREQAGRTACAAVAMAALSVVLSRSEDRERHDPRESVRWMLGAQAAAPDHSYVQDVLTAVHCKGWLRKLAYNRHRRSIPPHDIPGADNAMV